MRSLNPRSLNQSLLNSCFIEGELAPSRGRVGPILCPRAQGVAVLTGLAPAAGDIEKRGSKEWARLIPVRMGRGPATPAGVLGDI